MHLFVVQTNRSLLAVETESRNCHWVSDDRIPPKAAAVRRGLSERLRCEILDRTDICVLAPIDRLRLTGRPDRSPRDASPTLLMLDTTLLIRKHFAWIAK